MDAVGMIETNSIPTGIQAGDAMLKAADVSLVMAQPVCAGKYIVMVTGDVAAVTAAVEAGKESAAETLVDQIIIANIHRQVIKAISGCTEVQECGAVGIIETFSLASAVLAADYAVKSADVDLVEIRLGRGLGGKAFVILTGEVASADHAAKAAKEGAGTEGMIARIVVIPSPHPDLFKAIY